MPQTASLGINRGSAEQLSMSELDAIKRKLIALWNPPIGVENPQDLIVTVRFKLKRDGTLDGGPLVMNSGRSETFMIARDKAIRALEDLGDRRRQAEVQVLVRDDALDHGLQAPAHAQAAVPGLGLNRWQYARVRDEAALSGGGHAAELGGGSRHRGGGLQRLRGGHRVAQRGEGLGRRGRHRTRGDGRDSLHGHGGDLAFSQRSNRESEAIITADGLFQRFRNVQRGGARVVGLLHT